MSRRYKNFLLLVIGLGVGLPVLAYGLLQLSEAYASKSWPAVTGRVVEARVTSSSTRHSGTSYRPDIAFEYTVAGIRYRSGTWSYDDPPLSRADAEAVVARYAEGTTVDVYYAPNTPSQAVLERGAGDGSYMLPGFGLALTSLGFVAALRFRRSSGRR